MDRYRFDHLTRGLASAATRRSALRGIAAGALAFGAARGLASAADCGGGNAGGAKKKEKTCLCHFSSSGSEGSVICVGGKAANKHLKHGDAVCGDGADCPSSAPGSPCTVSQQTCDLSRLCNNDNECRVNGSNATCVCGPASEPGGDRKCAAVVG